MGCRRPGWSLPTRRRVPFGCRKCASRRRRTVPTRRRGLPTPRRDPPGSRANRKLSRGGMSESRRTQEPLVGGLRASSRPEPGFGRYPRGSRRVPSGCRMGRPEWRGNPSGWRRHWIAWSRPIDECVCGVRRLAPQLPQEFVNSLGCVADSPQPAFLTPTGKAV